MPKLNVKKRDRTKRIPPDIFVAALNDDPYELAQAIAAGQSLLQKEFRYRRTPLHIAAQNGSLQFMKAAATYPEIDAWALDTNEYTAYDLAARRSDQEIQEILYDLMYS